MKKSKEKRAHGGPAPFALRRAGARAALARPCVRRQRGMGGGAQRPRAKGKGVRRGGFFFRHDATTHKCVATTPIRTKSFCLLPPPFLPFFLAPPFSPLRSPLAPCSARGRVRLGRRAGARPEGAPPGGREGDGTMSDCPSLTNAVGFFVFFFFFPRSLSVGFVVGASPVVRHVPPSALAPAEVAPLCCATLLRASLFALASPSFFPRRPLPQRRATRHFLLVQAVRRLCASAIRRARPSVCPSSRPVLRFPSYSQILDDFIITRTLGTGSFGRVLLAQNKDTNGSAVKDEYKAIKIISKERVIKTRQVCFGREAGRTGPAENRDGRAPPFVCALIS